MNPLVITLTRILIDIPFFEKPILPINRAIVGATVEASETMEKAMTILEKLSFSDRTRAPMLASLIGRAMVLCRSPSLAR